MTQTMSSAEETKLLREVKQAVDLVDNQDMSPNAALTKVAREHQWSRGALRSAVNAYNNGRQVSQWRANDNILDKLAEFPLADYDAIHKSIWGGTAKEAADTYQASGIDPEYAMPPSWLRSSEPDRHAQVLEKVAGDRFGALAERSAAMRPEHVSMIAAHASRENMVKAFGAHQRAKFACDEARRQFSAAHDLLRVRLRLLDNYFSKSAYDRLPFAVVEDAAATYYGADGRALFDLLSESFPREKRAADSRLFLEQPLNLEHEPFTYVRNAIASAKEVAQTKRAYDEAHTTQVKVAEDQLRPFAVTPRQSSTEDPLSISLIKDAGLEDFGGGIGAGTKALLDEALGSDKTKDEVTKTWLDLESPEHENELRKIRAQAMLTEMMSDPQNPISGYNPDQVLKVYDQVGQAAPRIADQPALIQPHLLKRLSGHTEPFEGKELVDTEKTLGETRQRTPDTELLSSAPESILG